MKLTLRQRIFWWSAGSTLAVFLVVFVIVNQVFSTTILRNERENLVAKARLLAELHDAEVEEGLNRTVSVGTTPMLRAAVETGDSLTIRQNLEILRSTSGFDWLMLTTADGLLLTATAGAPVERVANSGAAGIIEEARYYDTGDLWAHDVGLTQVHATGIFLGDTPIAVLLTGSTIGSDRVNRLEAATGQRIVFVSPDRVAIGPEGLSSEQRSDMLRMWPSDGTEAYRDVADSMVLDGDQVGQFTLAGQPFIGTTIPLPNSRGKVVGRLVAFRSLEEAMRPARDLGLALLIIALAGVLLAFGASYLLSRRVTGPVDRLLAETIRLGTGNLDEPIRLGGEDEIGRLAQGFEQMRLSLREARAELVRDERLSAIGRAASAIVHDFRQPVTVIKGYISMLRLDLDDHDEREEDLAVIDSQLERLNTMMSEILDFVRGGDSVGPTLGSVPDLLEEVTGAIRPLLRERKISLAVEPGYTGDWLLDYPRTRRVLENLVRNAAAAAGPGGHVTVRSHETSERLRLVVEDTGPGIPEEVRDNLFEPFVTFGKKEGTGLGLAIVKSFTEKQGGRVGFETSSSGTRFLLDFPREAA